MDIYEPHQTFLGFSWDFNGISKYFVFTVLPFGLSTACYCFTKLLKQLLLRWRSMDHLAFIYIDDGISGHEDKLSATAANCIHQNDLSSAGLTANREKCNWQPTHANRGVAGFSHQYYQNAISSSSKED